MLKTQSAPAADTTSVLDVRDLSVRFTTQGRVTHAVDRVSFTLDKSEVLGLVGESGCGKSVTAMALLRLLPSTATVDGQALFQGVDLLSESAVGLRRVRG